MINGLSITWHDLVRYFHLWGYALKWPLYFVAGWAAILYRRWRKSRNEAAAQGWPSVDGLIISAKSARVSNTSRFMVTLEYSYFLEEYNYGNYTHEFSKQADADELVRQMKDKRVQIRYNPSHPKQSVLEQSVIEQHVLLAPRFG